MFEESSSLPSIWASMNSWFTPTVLFVFLNLMIGTIFFRSSLSNPQQDQESEQDPQTKPPKSPPLLQRLKSINLKTYISTKQNSNTLFTPQQTYKNQNQETENNYNFQTLERETSNTHYPTQQTHKNNQNQERNTQFDNQQTLERETSNSHRTHYPSQETHKNNQNQERDTHFDFQQTLERETSNTHHTHYPSQQAHKNNQNQEIDTHYDFNQTHQNKNLERETHYPFQQILERETSNSNTNTNYQSHQTHKNQNQETDTLFNSQQTHQHQTLERETKYPFSLTLERETSNTHYPSHQAHQQKPQEKETQFIFHQTHQEKDNFNQTLERENEHVLEHTPKRQQTMNEFYCEVNDSHVSRTKSDTGYFTSKLPAKMMKKSASLKSAFGHFEDDEDDDDDVVEARRPATVRERSARVSEGDDEVDAKADDFISNFRDQLKMQRLKSFVRYNEMISRGSE